MASRPPDPAADALARNRFIAINAVRVTGVALVLFGLLVSQRAIDLPPMIAWVFIPIGLIDVFVLPQILARRWRSGNL